MDTAVNIAYWNLHGRQLSLKGDQVLVNGKPAILFHFSGFGVPSEGKLSKHSRRQFDPQTNQIVARLVSQYEALLLAEKQKNAEHGWSGDFKFVTAPLGQRMKQASEKSGFKYTFIDDTQGFFARVGRFFDRTLQGI
jgi:hypothetical protein